MLNFSLIQNDHIGVIGKFVHKYKNAFFLFFFILQLSLNLYKIDVNSLWYDECFTVATANKSIAGIVEVSKLDVNPPLYPIIVHYWMKCFGISEFSVRLLSAIAGALASAFLFRFCLRFFNWQTGIFSSLIFFSSYVLFFYSQEARTYSFVLLFVVLSNYLFFFLTTEKHKWKSALLAVLLGIVNIGLFYLHFLSCFSIIGQGIFFLFFLFKKQDEAISGGSNKIRLNLHLIKYYFLSWVVFIMLLLPFYQRFLFLVKEGGKKMWLQKPIYQDLKLCIYEMFNTREIYQFYVYTAVIICVLLFFKKLRYDSFRMRLLLFGVISGPLILYLNYLVASYSPIFLLRYVLFTFLGFIIIFSYLLSSLTIRFEYKFVIFLILISYSFTQGKIPKELKQDYKNAVKYLKSVKTNEVLISTDLPDIFAYYYDKDIFDIKDDEQKAKTLIGHGIYVQNYDLMWPDKVDFTHIKDIYYTQSFEYLNDGERIVMKKLSSKFEFVEKIDRYKEIGIIHYRNKDFKSW